MIGKNIRYYRLLRNMSLQDLADRVGLNKMAISNYENGKREPRMEICKKIAGVLNVSLVKLISSYGNDLAVERGPFRKNANLSKEKTQLVFGQEDSYLGRLFDIISLLGDASLPSLSEHPRVSVTNTEEAGKHLREMLGLPYSGPVGNITDILENNGYIVCPVDNVPEGFSGHSGKVNGRPYIAVNIHMNAERQRFTLIHELAHQVFVFKEDQNEERLVNEIAGAFLLPEGDIKRELGPKRRDIRGDLQFIRKEYGIASSAIVMRARQTGIITQETYTITLKWMSANGMMKQEKQEIMPEETHLLELLTLRAVDEEQISISKAAEVLDKPLIEIRKLWLGSD